MTNGTKSPDLTGIIAKWQRREGINDRQAAAMLGVSVSMLGQWRAGSSAPNRNRWPLIAERCGLSVEQVAVAVAQGVKP